MHVVAACGIPGYVNPSEMSVAGRVAEYRVDDIGRRVGDVTSKIGGVQRRPQIRNWLSDMLVSGAVLRDDEGGHISEWRRLNTVVYDVGRSGTCPKDVASVLVATT